MEARTLAIKRLDTVKAHLHQLFGRQRAGLKRCIEVGNCRLIEIDLLRRRARRIHQQATDQRKSKCYFGRKVFHHNESPRFNCITL